MRLLNVSAEGMLPLAVSKWVVEGGFPMAVFVAADELILESLVAALSTFLPNHRILAVPAWNSLPYYGAARPGASPGRASRRWLGSLRRTTSLPLC